MLINSASFDTSRWSLFNWHGLQLAIHNLRCNINILYLILLISCEVAVFGLI